VVGIVGLRDLIVAARERRPETIEPLARAPLVVPETNRGRRVDQHRRLQRDDRRRAAGGRLAGMGRPGVRAPGAAPGGRGRGRRGRVHLRVEAVNGARITRIRVSLPTSRPRRRR
jgi:hypothetical protein